MDKKLGINFIGINRHEYIEQRQEMTPVGVAAYLDLMVYAAKEGGYLPEDENLWRRVCSCSPKIWLTVRPQLERVLVKTDNGWTFSFVLNSMRASQAAIARGNASYRSKSLKTKDPPSNGLTLVSTSSPGNKKEERGKIDTEYEDRLPSLSSTSREETLFPAAPGKEYFYENGMIKLNEKDFRRWEAAFPKLNLRAELEALAGWTELTPKNWFHAIPQALRNRNEKITRSNGRRYVSV